MGQGRTGVAAAERWGRKKKKKSTARKQQVTTRARGPEQRVATASKKRNGGEEELNTKSNRQERRPGDVRVMDAVKQQQQARRGNVQGRRCKKRHWEESAPVVPCGKGRGGAYACKVVRPDESPGLQSNIRNETAAEHALLAGQAKAPRGWRRCQCRPSSHMITVWSPVPCIGISCAAATCSAAELVVVAAAQVLSAGQGQDSGTCGTLNDRINEVVGVAR